MARTKRGAERGALAAWRQLWAPWRTAYLRAARLRPKACIFCLGTLRADARKRRLVLYQDRRALIMLNRYPYNNGHIMVAPRRHLGSLALLTREERGFLAELLSASIERLTVALKPDGFNVGANLGRSAGAGFADHVHWHIVPRWDGDANFMPVVASTRVLSQHLESSFDDLAPLFKGIGAKIS